MVANCNTNAALERGSRDVKALESSCHAIDLALKNARAHFLILCSDNSTQHSATAVLRPFEIKRLEGPRTN
jgi:hypothetical protein